MSANDEIRVDPVVEGSTAPVLIRISENLYRTDNLGIAITQLTAARIHDELGRALRSRRFIDDLEHLATRGETNEPRETLGEARVSAEWLRAFEEGKTVMAEALRATIARHS